MFGKDKKVPRMSLEQTLEQERKELLRNLDGLKSPKAPRADNASRFNSGRGKNLSLLRSNKQEKSESGRRASVSSPLASSSPWTNTLLSEWDDSIYEPSDDANEAEPARRSSDSVTQLKREKERKLKEREVDIDAGFLYGMQPSVPHIVLPQRHASSKSFFSSSYFQYNPGENSNQIEGLTCANGLNGTLTHDHVSRIDPATFEQLSPRYRASSQSQPQSQSHSAFASNAGSTIKSRRLSSKKNRLSESDPDLPANMDNDAPDSISEASVSPTLSKASLNLNNDPERNGRLAKDRAEGADENSDSTESSDEGDISSEEDAYDIRKGPVGPRGRSKSPRGRSKTKKLSPGTSPARSPAPPGGWSGKRGPGPLPPGSPRVGGALSLFNELNEEGMSPCKTCLR